MKLIFNKKKLDLRFDSHRFKSIILSYINQSNCSFNPLISKYFFLQCSAPNCQSVMNVVTFFYANPINGIEWIEHFIFRQCISVSGKLSKIVDSPTIQSTHVTILDFIEKLKQLKHCCWIIHWAIECGVCMCKVRSQYVHVISQMQCDAIASIFFVYYYKMNHILDVWKFVKYVSRCFASAWCSWLL